MNREKCCFQNMLQKFFLQRMINQRNLSPETIKSYRDSFKLFVRYMRDAHGIAPASLTIEHLQAEHILGFLSSLEKVRDNQPKTINNRLAAIHAFLRFLSFEKPEYSGLIARGLGVPFRKEEKRQMDFLTKDEIDALLDVCNTGDNLGRRDKLMLLMLYNTGARVSELLALKGRDVVFDKNASSAFIKVTGKGRKERTVPLWRNTTRYLRDFMTMQGTPDDGKIFINCVGKELTRSGVRHRLASLVTAASQGMPTLCGKNISPHTFRHTTALHLLQSGVDLSTIAIWLGHESLMTTHKYMEADLEMKKKILENMAEPTVKDVFYKPSQDVLAFLSSL